ncbi:MAG: cache domain-containing protein [Burkholderiaceae bacterium]|nr:cache domain-containing protein [Burkholderiaceae bacterium]
MKLKSFLFIAFGIAVVIPMTALYVSENIEADIDKLEITELQVREADVVSANLSRYFFQAERIVSLAADYFVSHSDNLEDLQERLRIIYGTCNEFLDIHFDNLDGISIAAYPTIDVKGQSSIGQNHQNRLHWFTLMKNNSIHITNIFQGIRTSNKISADIAYKIFDPEGIPIGYVIAALDLDRFAKEVAKLKKAFPYTVHIVDKAGSLVYSDGIVPTQVTRFINSDILEKTESLKDGYWFELDLKQEEQSCFIKKIDHSGWYLIVSRDANYFGPEEMSRPAYFGLVLFLTVLSIWLLVFVSDRLFSHNISKLRRQISLRKRTIDEKTEIVFPDELSQIQEDVSQLLGGRFVLQQLCKDSSVALNSLERETERQRHICRNWLSILGQHDIGVILIDQDSNIEGFNQESSRLTGLNLAKGCSLQELAIAQLGKNCPKFGDNLEKIVIYFPKTALYISINEYLAENVSPILYILILREEKSIMDSILNLND